MVLPAFVRHVGRRLVLAAFFALLIAGSALAQPSGKLPPVYEGAGLDERLGETLPLDVQLRDETGAPVTLRSLMRPERPLLLNFVYYDCPMLCSILLDGMTNALRQLDWTPGDQFDVATISFSVGEDAELAANAKEKFATRLGRPAAADGWHFLTGDSIAIGALTTAAGFQFKWVPEQQQYVHPATILFVSPDGVITRYLHGLQFQPRDVRTALVEASNGSIGTPLDQAILFCFKYDPDRGSYVPYAANLMKLGGLLTLIVLGAVLFVFWRRESRRLVASHTAGASAE